MERLSPTCPLDMVHGLLSLVLRAVWLLFQQRIFCLPGFTFERGAKENSAAKRPGPLKLISLAMAELGVEGADQSRRIGCPVK